MAWNVEASQLDDQRHLAHALAILLTVGSTPSIYAGDEQGFRGLKEHWAGGDDAVRPAFPDAPDQPASSAGASTGCTSS
jgi:cyclomaltodextrinase / maltogenic alpha-amylase / neopullulanase